MRNLLQASRGHERELVEGQRPDVPGRERERDALDEPGLGRAQERAEGVAVGRAAKGERAAERRLRAGADRDHERVVLDFYAVGRDGDLAGRVHTLELAGSEPRTGLRRERGELERTGCPEPERLGDRERPVPEVVLGCDELDVDEPRR